MKAIQPAAIGIVLDRKKEAILLVRRRDVPLWVLPGGGVEEGESVEEAVQREVKEETGYEVEIIRKGAIFRPINRLSSVTTLLVCSVSGGEGQLSSETSALAFYSLSELPKSLFSLHAAWLHEVMATSSLIQRDLHEVSYSALLRYAWQHPWQVLRFTYTRLCH